LRRLQREPTTPVLFALRAQLQVRALPSLHDRRASENGLRASIVSFLAKPIFQSPLIAFCHRALRQPLAHTSQLFERPILLRGPRGHSHASSVFKHCAR
jgi:hypothetical protein